MDGLVGQVAAGHDAVRHHLQDDLRGGGLHQLDLVDAAQERPLRGRHQLIVVPSAATRDQRAVGDLLGQLGRQLRLDLIEAQVG